MQRSVQTREATAMQRAETIMKTLATDAGAAAAVRANPALNEVMTTMRDAQATVARSGLQLSDSAKKDFLQATTIIGQKKPRKRRHGELSDLRERESGRRPNLRWVGREN